MRHGAGGCRFGQGRFAHLCCLGRLGEIQHVIEPAFGLRVKAGITRELKAEMLFADPDLAAVFTFAVAALVEMVGKPASVAERLAVLVECLAAN